MENKILSRGLFGVSVVIFIIAFYFFYGMMKNGDPKDNNPDDLGYTILEKIEKTPGEKVSAQEQFNILKAEQLLVKPEEIALGALKTQNKGLETQLAAAKISKDVNKEELVQSLNADIKEGLGNIKKQEAKIAEIKTLASGEITESSYNQLLEKTGMLGAKGINYTKAGERKKIVSDSLISSHIFSGVRFLEIILYIAAGLMILFLIYGVVTTAMTNFKKALPSVIFAVVAIITFVLAFTLAGNSSQGFETSVAKISSKEGELAAKSAISTTNFWVTGLFVILIPAGILLIVDLIKDIAKGLAK